MSLLCRKLISLAYIVVLFSCGKNESHLFTKLDKSETGIAFQNTIFEDGPLNVANYIYFYNGSGVAIGDINNDGLQDILFTGNMVKNRLYLNKGNFKFENITDKAGIAEKQGWCTGATMVDINGDGLLDIYICRSADATAERRKNLLFINNGDLTFIEKAQEYGLADEGYSTQAGFFDYDKDGDLDCFIINHSIPKYSAGIQENAELRKEYNADFASKLYRNDNGHFTNVSVESGISSNVFTFGLGLALSDINNDGWPDVYVSNDFNEPDYLFLNNKNGTFTESLAGSMNETSMYSMGSDAADFNNDGLIDIMTLDMLAEDNRTQKMHSGQDNFDKFQLLFNKGFHYQYSRNMLQKNNGDGTFSEIGQIAGVSNTDWSWSALFCDYDNDGNKDLFITNGYVRDYSDMDFMKYSMARLVHSMHGEDVDAVNEYVKKMPLHNKENYIFQNNGDETFSKRNQEWGFSAQGVSSGAAYADLDNDGDMDLVINNTNEYAGIFKNNRSQLPDNNYIRIKFKGDKKNVAGIGSKVVVYCKENKYFQEQMPVRGFQSSVDPVLNFGLGSNANIDSVIVTWPTDKIQKWVAVKSNLTLIADLANAETIQLPLHNDLGNTYFIPQPSTDIVHNENSFNDFTKQPLLLSYLSRQGPCIAKADINEDGREDIFIGGAKNQSSRIYIQQKDGSYISDNHFFIPGNTASECTAAEFFDANGDGNVDLYVANGGYEFNQYDTSFQDRLYISDGMGSFSEKQLPSLLFSKSCVKSADIDGDGDLDLFVGGRLVPGKYPLVPPSKILLNDGKGNFTDATSSIAPSFDTLGMVTDAEWMDINKDGLPDLIVVGDWMPIKIFINQKGKLKDESANYIKFESHGWWNRIFAEDFDGDSDKDLILGNQGINTQFKASEQQPLSLYYKDFDNNGSIDPVFCYYIGGISYPFASRDDLAEQLPMLKKQFSEYHNYADATIHDIFSEEELQDAQLLKASELRTLYLENKGPEGFVRRELPPEVQYAPVYAISSIDADGDGNKDLVIAGNNSWTRIKFGKYDATYGMLLRGDNKGNFKYIPQWQSGLSVHGNVRSMQVIPTADGDMIMFGINDAAVKCYKVRQKK